MKLSFSTALVIVAMVGVSLFAGYLFGQTRARPAAEPSTPPPPEEFTIGDEPDDICVINGQKEIYAAGFRNLESSSLTIFEITYLSVDGDVVTQEWTVDRKGPISPYHSVKRNRYILNSHGTCPSD